MATSKVCILCQSTCDKFQSRETIGCILLVSRFYSKLPFESAKVRSEDDRKQSKGISSKSTLLPSSGALTVCQICSPLIETALKKKETVNGLVSSVRQLQSQLQKEMTQLQDSIAQFYEDMKNIEGLLDNASHNRSLTTSTSSTSTNMLTSLDLNTIKIFGERIMKVMDDLKTRASSTDENTSRKNNFDDVNQQFSVCAEAEKSTYVKMEMDMDEMTESIMNIVDEDYDNNLPEDNCDSESNNPGQIENEEAKKVYERCDLSTVDCTGMSAFKKYIVLQAVRRKSRILSNGVSYQFKNKQDSLVDSPLNSQNKYFFDYNAETGELSLQDIIITIIDKEENTGYVQCSKCEHQVHSFGTKYSEVHRRILDHVLGKHLNLYHCSQCDVKFTSRGTFFDHSCTNRQKVTCDICGKPCSSNKRVRVHKWSHMNAEEMQQAIDSGLRDPRKPKPVEGKPFQCSTCGKSFATRCSLNSHAKIHQMSTVMCPVCGKLVLERTFARSHSKVCRPQDEEEGPPVQCTRCEKSFKTLERMKEHIANIHSDKALERSHLCSICNKGFKSKWNLRDHLRSHTDDRPFECQNGCGAKFKAASACKKHERVCSGGGTSFGPKRKKSWS